MKKVNQWVDNLKGKFDAKNLEDERKVLNSPMTEEEFIYYFKKKGKNSLPAEGT